MTLRLTIIALIAAGSIFSYQYFVSPPETQVSFVTASVTKGDLEERISATGAVDAVTTVEVGSQLSGQLAELSADFNDVVAKGQVLAVLDQESFIARLRQAEASLQMARAKVEIASTELERARTDLENSLERLNVKKARLDNARARLKFAKNDQKRKESLASRKAVSVSDVEAAQAERLAAEAAVREARAEQSVQEIDIAAAEVDVARYQAELSFAKASIPEKQAMVRAAEIDLRRTTITSPIDGVVINRNVDAGQTVAASLEAPTLFTIAQDLSEMEVHARVDETDIGKIQVGQRAFFSVDAFPGRVFDGEVVQIRKSPSVLSNVVTYRVIVKTRNPDLVLLPGMTALIDIVVMQREELLTVPFDAIAFQPSSNHEGAIGAAHAAEAPREKSATVWKLRAGGEIEAVPVTIGDNDGYRVEILSGDIAVGDELVVNEVVQTPPRRFFGIHLGQ